MVGFSFFFFSSRRRHTRLQGDWSSDVCSSDLGTVKDQSGAVLPGVEVTATHTDTGISRRTITNETGSYILPNVAVGPYRIEIGRASCRERVVDSGGAAVAEVKACDGPYDTSSH